MPEDQIHEMDELPGVDSCPWLGPALSAQEVKVDKRKEPRSRRW